MYLFIVVGQNVKIMTRIYDSLNSYCQQERDMFLL